MDLAETTEVTASNAHNKIPIRRIVLFMFASYWYSSSQRYENYPLHEKKKRFFLPFSQHPSRLTKANIHSNSRKFHPGMAFTAFFHYIREKRDITTDP